MKNTKIILFFLTLLSFLSLPCNADVYRYIDKYGRVIFTDKPEHKGYKKLVRTWKGWVEQKKPKNFDWVGHQRRYDTTIRNTAKIYKLPHELLHAVITVESWYNPNAVSRAGAIGLMQLMPETAKRYGVNNRRDAKENIDGGSRYLSDLLRMFNNNIKLALAAYNAGENAVKKYKNEIPPYRETQDYVRKVLKYYKKYQQTMI